MRSLVAGGLLMGFFGSIVTLILAFCLGSGRRTALVAYTIFTAESALMALSALASGAIVPFLIIAAPPFVLGLIAYATRRIGPRRPAGNTRSEAPAPWNQAGPWPPGGGNPFDSHGPRNG